MFHFTGGPQTAVVPAGVHAAILTLIGGRGGIPWVCHPTPDPALGGKAAEVTARISVSPGERLTIKVGGHGGDGHHTGPGAGGWGVTSGGRGGSSSSGDGGGGGGASGVEVAGTSIAVAGGGGGGGGSGFHCDFDEPGAGGHAGSPPRPGLSGSGPGAGLGGTAADNQSGAGTNGGDGSWYGGGGGGGGAGRLGGAGGQGGGFGGGGGGGGGAGSSALGAGVNHGKIITAIGAHADGSVQILWGDTPECTNQQVNVPYDATDHHFDVQCPGTVRPSNYEVVAGPRHGRLLSDDPGKATFRYRPERNFSGIDSMTYVAFAEGRPSKPTTVTFVIARHCTDQVIHLPVNTQGYNADHGVKVELNCSPSNDPGAVFLVRKPGHGWMTPNLISTSTSFKYIGFKDFSGVDSMQYTNTIYGPMRLYQGPPATITFVVGNQAYPTCPDQHQRDVGSSGARIALHCPQMSGPVTYKVTALPQHGHLADLDLANGTGRYVPRQGYSGEDSVMFQAFGAGGQVSASFRLTFSVTSAWHRL